MRRKQVPVSVWSLEMNHAKIIKMPVVLLIIQPFYIPLVLVVNIVYVLQNVN